MDLLLPLIILSFSVYFLIRLRFFILLHPLTLIKKILLEFKNKNNRRSLFLALAGTLGVGNILGVSLGVAVGGVSVVFWIFISGRSSRPSLSIS